MEIKTEVINVMGELGETQATKFAQKLASNFTKWDEDRQAQVDTAKQIMEEVYLNQPKRKFKKGEEWRSDTNLNALHNIKRTINALLWREIYQNPNQMFNVRGTNEETEKTAKDQKASIVDSFNKMNIGIQFDLATNDGLDIGELIAKIDWVSKKKIVKRQRKDIGFYFQNIISNISGAGYMTAPLQDVEIPVYENARVEAISPFMFVFDHSRYKLFDEDSWDSCIKIYKRFASLDDVKANKIYNIKQEWLDELNAEGKENKTVENKELVDLRSENKYGDNYAVLFAHGDFKIDGKIYKNYVAEVLAGKYLIRFEKNPMHINPFVFCAFEFDPVTKRGIPPLKSVKDLCKKEEELTNLAFDVQKLTANPPCYAHEEMFDEDNTNNDGTIPLAPGMVIKYKSSFEGGLPTNIQVNGNGIADLIALLNQKVADLSSVSSVMFGNIESEKRTATELTLADKGSNSQIAKMLDTIYQNFNIPIVKKVAELLATFKDGVDFVYAQEKGKNVEYRITNEIRQAQYNYYYEDRNALNDRKMVVEKLYQVCQGAFQLPQLAQQLDEKEIFTLFVEALGFDNIDSLFKDATPATQFAEQLNKIPQEMQQQVVGMFAQQLQQMMQQFQVQQQQAEMQAQAQKQVQMQQLRDNARTEMELANARQLI